MRAGQHRKLTDGQAAIHPRVPAADSIPGCPSRGAARPCPRTELRSAGVAGRATELPSWRCSSAIRGSALVPPGQDMVPRNGSGRGWRRASCAARRSAQSQLCRLAAPACPGHLPLGDGAGAGAHLFCQRKDRVRNRRSQSSLCFIICVFSQLVIRRAQSSAT